MDNLGSCFFANDHIDKNSLKIPKV